MVKKNEGEYRYSSLDILKTIAAFMVCYQHACGTGILYGYFLAVARIAVPLFIMITGYFYQDTCNHRHERSQIVKFLKIAIQMFVIYFCVDFLFNGVTGNLKTYLLSYLDSKLWCRFLIFNTPLTAGHSWYMWAMIYVLTLFLLVPGIKNNKIFRTVFTLMPLAAVPLLSKYYFFFSETPFPADFYRNSIIPVLSYFIIGIMIRKNNECILKFSLPLRLGAVCISLLGLILERAILLNVQRMDFKSGSYFFTAILAVAVFVLFLDLGKVDYNALLAVFGRKYSLNFYIIHQIFVKVETKLFDVNTAWQFVGVAFVTVITVLVIVSCDKIKTKMIKED